MQYNTEEIGKRIKAEREKRKWSQETLGKKLFISGKQVSVYESGHMPPIENLLKLCELFDCELGYLLGESGYEKGSRLETQICDKIGLTPEAIKTLEYITSPQSRFNSGYEAESYRRILNSLITSGEFVSLMEALHFLDDCGQKEQSLDDELSSTFDELIIQAAFDAKFGTDDYEHDTSLPHLPAEVTAAMNMIDKNIDEKQTLNYSTKVARYELNEAFMLLINDVFGNKRKLQ